EGEGFVKACCEDYVIARASVLYGWHPWKPNFAAWVIGSLRRGKPISVVVDHYNSPTFADNLARALLEIVGRDVTGVYHTAGAERISRFDFAVKAARVFGLDDALIRPIKMEELRVWVARRPRDSSLSVDKALRGLGIELLDATKGLLEMKREEAGGKP
ncbi:TPA: dTDP-4-dehydrorhamnose reductase, partial [Candidatus Bathyarchaeota archaeon]|nr:dTDP-4-dehydrorhamnose reductase [Candidatus Bathyarchaeota archaeon]